MAAVSTESRLSAIEAALGLPDGGSEGGAAPAEVKEMIARVSELEAKVAKRDFQIAHLKAALDRKDATLAAAGVDPHSATNSFRDTAAAGSAAAHA